jgi:hypothetical protein
MAFGARTGKLLSSVYQGWHKQHCSVAGFEVVIQKIKINYDKICINILKIFINILKIVIN